MPCGGIGGCGAGCARSAKGAAAPAAASPASVVRLVSIKSSPSIAYKVVITDRMAGGGPAARSPVFHQSQIAREFFEALGLPDHGIRRMPEPGGRDRLEIAAFHLVLVIFQHALRRTDMQIGEPQAAQLWKVLCPRLWGKWLARCGRRRGPHWRGI